MSFSDGKDYLPHTIPHFLPRASYVALGSVGPSSTAVATTSPSSWRLMLRQTSAAPGYRHGAIKNREVDGPFLPTTMGGIQAALEDIARDTATQPSQVAPRAPAINCCVLNPAFTMEHLRTSGAQSTASIPGPSKAFVTSMVTSLFRQVVTMRGDALRSASCSLVFLFLTLVLGPHRSGTPSSMVKAETQAMIHIWQRGELQALAARATAARLERPKGSRNKKAKSARRAAALLRHN